MIVLFRSKSQPVVCFWSHSMPTLPHKVAPNYQFALRNDSLFQAAQQKIEDNMVDLDETTSISEYTAMFEQALRLEYEEHLRLYELYSLYHVNIIPIDGLAHPPLPSEGNRLVNSKVYKMARIFIDGIGEICMYESSIVSSHHNLTHALQPMPDRHYKLVTLYFFVQYQNMDKFI